MHHEIQITLLYGQPNGTYIRPIYTHNPADHAAVISLCNSLPPEFEYAHQPKLMLADVLNSYPKTQDPTRCFLYGVSDLDYRDPFALLGFIGLLPVDVSEVKDLHQKEILGPQNDQAHVFEIYYAKLQHPDIPCKMISNAIRQALIYLSHQEAAYDEENDEKLTPNWSVVAYVKPGNKASATLLESVGFVNKQTYQDLYGNSSLVFVLNWQLLNEGLQKRIDKKIAPYSSF